VVKLVLAEAPVFSAAFETPSALDLMADWFVNDVAVGWNWEVRRDEGVDAQFNWPNISLRALEVGEWKRSEF